MATSHMVSITARVWVRVRAWAMEWNPFLYFFLVNVTDIFVVLSWPALAALTFMTSSG